MSVNEIAHQMGLVPLMWIGALWCVSRRVDAAYVWIAVALGVSWLADSVADLTATKWVPALVYPLSQSGIAGAVLLPRQAAVKFIGLLVLAAIVAVLWSGWGGPDVILPSVGWFGVAVIAWRFWALPERLRAALLVYFGGGCVAWLIFCRWGATDPNYVAWYELQLTRMEGIGLFCWATLATGPRLRMTR